MGRADERILVGLADDDTAPAVLAVAQRLGAALGAQVLAVHVGAQLPRSVAEAAAAVGVDVAVEPGEAVTVLGHRLHGPDVVMGVVGCRDVGGPRPAGHVSLGLVERAPVPVVVVPPGTHVGGQPLHDVLLPLDSSSVTAAAVDPTIAALAGSGLRVTVVHVFDPNQPPRFLDQPHHGLDAWGHEFLARYSQPDLDLVLRTGTPGGQLLDVVAATEPDLVVLGWSQDLSPGRARTIRELLTASPAPLLLVPTDGADRSAGTASQGVGRGRDW